MFSLSGNAKDSLLFRSAFYFDEFQANICKPCFQFMKLKTWFAKTMFLQLFCSISISFVSLFCFVFLGQLEYGRFKPSAQTLFIESVVEAASFEFHNTKYEPGKSVGNLSRKIIKQINTKMRQILLRLKCERLYRFLVRLYLQYYQFFRIQVQW